MDRRRLTLVTAGPGLGKTTLLSHWARDHGAAWYCAGPEDRDPAVLVRGLVEALRVRVPTLGAAAIEPALGGDGWVIPPEGQASLAADQLASLLSERLEAQVVLVVDDAHEVAGAAGSCRLLSDLVRSGPPRLHLVLSSRTDQPFAVARLRAQGLGLEVPGSALRFTAPETTALVTQLLGSNGDAIAVALHEATGGWPAGVRLIADWLGHAPPPQWTALVSQAGDAGGPLDAFLVEDVLPSTPGPVLGLLREVISLERFSAPLAAEVLGPRADDLVGVLVRDGLWVVPDETHAGWLVVPPVLRRFLRSRLAVRADEGAMAMRRAAAWMEGSGATDPAFTRLLGQPQEDAAVKEAGISFVRGDYDAALAILRPFLAGDGGLAMSVGLVAGLAHHFRGEVHEALALYDRALDSPGNDALRAFVLGWQATACWLRGDVERCRIGVAKAEECAARSRDDRAWAIVHTVRAMLAALEGEAGAMRHYDRALARAEAAHDHFQIVRIRINRAARFHSEGYYRQALSELDEAVRLAELAGIGAFRGLALINRGQALMGLGRLDEAAREFEAAKADYESRGSHRASYAFAHLGRVHQLQGHETLARTDYEESIAIAEATGDHQPLVQALVGLAALVAASDPPQAARLVARAVSATSLDRPDALIAAAETAVRAGDRTGAISLADDAIVAARTRRDRPALAEALEVKATALDDVARAAALLDEASTIWRGLDNPLGEAKVVLARARLGGPSAREAARQAADQLRRLGARALAADAARLQAELDRAALPPLSVRVLGRFTVDRGDGAVATSEWQSRKARDLLKILIARRGRPVPREVLFDLLWEDEDPARAASRLSVTLSTLRSVLDPSKRFDAEHFIANDRAAAWIRLEHVEVDVERFLSDARSGLAALADGDRRAASALLVKAEAAYGGEFLEEDPYEEWPVILREEARATYVSVAMALADLAHSAGDDDGAAAYLLRVLAKDAYDERAHLQLITVLGAAGRHGEARRMYRAYVDRMAEIDVEPAPYPGLASRSAPRTAAS